jgi:Bacterial transglutaminase-like cysteine proteinase BTLCP
MFLELLPELYDINGRQAYKPHEKKRTFRPTFPFGRYLDRPLSYHASNLDDIRRFLMSCKAASDEETFGKKEYWLPPDEFEKLKKGDCDEFALWTWRQLLHLGYPARFVAGRYGRYRGGHAWATFERDGKHYIADPNFRWIKRSLPRLTALRFHPIYSVEWDGKKVRFYSHRDLPLSLTLTHMLPLALEWLTFWSYTWGKLVLLFPLFLFNILRKRLRAASG